MEHQPMKTKQVLVVRHDLKMNAGKIGAQCSHGSLGVFSRDFDFAPLPNKRYRVTFEVDEAGYWWFHDSFTKPVLRVDSEAELLEVYEKALKAGLPCVLITDNGTTVFNGVPTNTCIAIGPAENEAIDKITGHLKLLRADAKADPAAKELEQWKKRALKAESENAELRAQGRTDGQRLHLMSPVVGWLRMIGPQLQDNLAKLRRGWQEAGQPELGSAGAQDLIPALEKDLNFLVDSTERRYREAKERETAGAPPREGVQDETQHSCSCGALQICGICHPLQ